MTMFLGTSINAQMGSYSKDVTMSLGMQPAMIVDMNDIDSKTAESYWTDYVREHSKLKKNKKADELYAEGVRIPAISSNPVDLFSKIEDLKGSSRLYVWIDNGGEFLTKSNNATVYKGAKNYLDDFALEAEKKHVEELLKDAEKDLKGLEKDLKGLEKDNEGYEKEIEDAKEKIMKMEKNIEENAVAQEEKTVEVEDQMSMILKIKERLASVGKVKTKM